MVKFIKFATTMKTILALLISCFIFISSAVASEPFCNLVTYDENSGLSQHLVKQIVADRDGMMWFATWNGINRFDGYDFAALRPGVDDLVRRYSSRFRDLILSDEGNIWCRIDDKVVLLDTRTYRFRDIHSELEKKFNHTIILDRWFKNSDGELVMKCKDGSYIVIPGESPENAYTTREEPDRKMRGNTIRSVSSIGPYDALAYSRTDPDGSVWGVTRNGEVIHRDGDGPVRVLAEMGLTDGSVRYSTKDFEGNIWLVSSKGAHCLTLGHLPFTRIKASDGDRVLAMARDSRGRLWVSDGDTRKVTLYSPDFSKVAYLAPDGKIVTSPVSFGRGIYSFNESEDGTMWLGAKPDGLFRLSPDGDSYKVAKRCEGNVYDTYLDRRGRLWVATLGDGVLLVDHPFSDSPGVRRISDEAGYPEDAMSCRRFLAEDADSILLVATTGGLLAMDISHDKPRMKLYATTPGDASSLGCVAVMDLMHGDAGQLLVATESDAVNLRTIASDGRWQFSNPFVDSATPSEVALSLSPAAEKGGILVVSHNLVYKVNDEGAVTTYGPTFWRENLRFREVRPLLLDNGSVVFGLEDGLIECRLDSAGSGQGRVLPVFTSVSIENRPDSLLSASTTTLTLDKNQRNITLHFSSLAHSGQSEITYEFRMHEGEWTRLGTNRSITLLDLEPGKYTLDIRALDASGRQSTQFKRLELIVEPKFHETLTARILFALLILALIFLAVRLIIYIRSIKRKQSETLEAYMSLLAKSRVSQGGIGLQPAGDASAETPAAEHPEAADTPRPQITEADRRFMDKIVEYVNGHLSDPDASVEGMAEAAAVSRSGLSRKMRSITGVSPADFLKQARLSHSAAMLLDTSLPIKEIAFECGFSDLNYFGKCFKSVYSLSPTAYRREKSPAD